MKLDRCVVRVYGYSVLAIVVTSAVTSAWVIGIFSEVPRIRYLVPILALFMGLLVGSWLVLVSYYVIRRRFSQTAVASTLTTQSVRV